MRQRLQYLYLGHLTLPYLIAACARYWSENNQRAQYIHVSLKVVVASSPFVSTCMHVSNMSSHSYILYGSVCQLPATNETHSYTYLRYLSKKAYLVPTLPFLMHEDWRVHEEWIIPSPEPGNSSQNSRHDGSLRVTSNFLPTSMAGGHVQPGKAPDGHLLPSRV